MNKNDRNDRDDRMVAVAPSPASTPEPLISTSFILVVSAIATGVAMLYLVWSNTGPEPAMPTQSAVTPMRATTPNNNSGEPPSSIAQQTGAEAGTLPRKPPPGDLLAAINQARAEKGIPTIAAPPPGQASWQGMSPKEAAKVFEDAVKAANTNTSSPASPFSPVQVKN